jgi:adenylate cyclase
MRSFVAWVASAATGALRGCADGSGHKVRFKHCAGTGGPASSEHRRERAISGLMTPESNDSGTAGGPLRAAPVSANPPHPTTGGHGHRLPLKLPFIEGLKRRNVGRVVLLYVAVCWLVLEPVHVIFHMLEVPVWANRLVIILMALGFPVAIVFAWVYEITPEGLQPTVEVARVQSIRTQTRGRLDRAIITVLLLALAYFVVDKFWLSKHVTAQEQVSTPPAEPVSAAQSTIANNSIALMPFVDMSAMKDQEYFGDGMAEEVLNLLTTIPKLKVIGRASSFQFKGNSSDVHEIGRTLGVAYLVEGSVRRSSNHIRVTAQLIDTRDGTHRWSETYDRDAGDVLKVQGEVAAGLVRALQLEVAPPILVQSRSSLRNSEAYDLYLRGLHASNRFDQRGFEGAVADFRRALELDPSFVPAAEALAKTLERMSDWGFVDPKTGWEQTRVAAQAALRLDGRSALAHAILGNVYTKYDWNWPAAAQELKTAVALAPADPTVLVCAAMERLAVGRWSEALNLLDSASTADPLDADIHHVTGWVYVRLRRFADAESVYQRALEISPTYTWGHYFLGIALLSEGKAEAALEEMEKETDIEAKLSGLPAVYQALHRTKEADAALARLDAEYAGRDAMVIAEAYAFRGRKDQAFEWLDKAYAQKDNNLYYIKGDPLLRNLEADPRYKTFLHKMNLSE